MTSRWLQPDGTHVDLSSSSSQSHAPLLSTFLPSERLNLEAVAESDPELVHSLVHQVLEDLPRMVEDLRSIAAGHHSPTPAGIVAVVAQLAVGIEQVLADLWDWDLWDRIARPARGNDT